VSGVLVVCATPIGNLGDVTLRVLDALREADAIACEDTRRTATLLARYEIAAPLVALHEHNEAARAGELVGRVRAGERIALVTDAGTPVVSDPGGRVIGAAIAAGAPVVVLPGASAVTAALVASGLGGDGREGAGFVFAGFLPRGPRRAAAAVRRLDALGLPIVAFESPQRLAGTLRELAADAPDRRAAVCRELTKLHEEVGRGTLAELAERFAGPARGEVALVLAAAPPTAPEPPADALAELADAVGTRRAADLAARLTGAPRNRLYRALTERG
jgi:16S rRNA (cytidine1402-2'-O)-methyltransferase